MPDIAQTTLYYEQQREFEKALAVLFLAVWADMDAQLRTAAVTGIILPSAASGVITAAQASVSRVVVGSAIPLTASGVGVSRYASLLTTATRDVQQGVIRAHSAFIGARVDEQTRTWLNVANYRANLAPTYEPLHLWVDPAGYRLSDRIWRVDSGARQQIDRYLTFNIRAGTPAEQMSRELRAMLLPERLPLTTARPLGVNVSFDAMRLGRTEIARAHTEMTFITAANNPFVTQMDWALSARHPKVDICDRLATIGMSGARIREPYDIGTSPHVVEDSHPQCICTNRPYVGDTAPVIETLTQARARLATAPVTPADAEGFYRWAYGA